MKSLKFIINGEEQEIPQAKKSKYIMCSLEENEEEFFVTPHHKISDGDVLVIDIDYELWNEQIYGFNIKKEASGLENDINVVCCPYASSSGRFLVGKIFIDKPIFDEQEFGTFYLFTIFERGDGGFPWE